MACEFSDCAAWFFDPQRCGKCAEKEKAERLVGMMREHNLTGSQGILDSSK